MLAGETIQEIGRDGAARAKLWLEKTGRVDVQFSIYETHEAPFLTFPNANGENYSFDIGGILRLEQGTVSFYGEVKKYASQGDQGPKYKEYLAKCYRAAVQSAKPHHFMWVTWHPFSVTTWTRLCSAQEIVDAVTLHKAAYCATDDVDQNVCAALEERLWLIVLSDRQEQLSMSNAMLATVKAAIVNGVAP